MLIEYDLVIIGATELGCHMALRARELGARVALVEQGERPDGAIGFRQWVGGPPAPNSGGAGVSLIQSPQNWGFGGGSPELEAIVLSDQLSQFTSEALQLRGVDYLASSGSWVKTPKSGFQVGERLLRSTSFVSALTPKRRVPVALWKCPCLFPEDFPLAVETPLPDRVAIVGEAIVGVSLAMRLNALGVAVTLIVPTPQILPQISTEGAFRLQMELEAAGVRVLTGTRLRSADHLHDQIQLQLAQEMLEVDQVILATAFERLDPERLGLRSLSGPALRHHRLRLVGSVRGSGFDSFDGLISNAESIALTEVQRVLMPWQRSRSVPVGQLTNPPSIWIGSPVSVSRRIPKAKPSPALTGQSIDGSLWYHLVLTRKGELVNATLVGQTAVQFGPLLSLMHQTKTPITALTTLTLSDPMQAQLLHQWVVEWEVRSRPSLRHELFLDGLAFRRRRSY